MTIHNIDCKHIVDISTKNELLTLNICSSLNLSAYICLADVRCSILSSRINCLKHVLNELVVSYPDWKFCLLAGHNTFQPSNRITRHNRLWKSLLARGIEIPDGEFICESVNDTQDGLRAFGAVAFQLDQLEVVHSVMLETQAVISYTCPSETFDNIALLVTNGWDSLNSKPPREIVEGICGKSGFVIDVHGEFDDRDVAVAVIGPKRQISALAGH